MRKVLAVLAMSFVLAGCEGTTLTNDPGENNPAYPPVDDRGNHDQTHRMDPPAPVWPADVDSGAGSGTR